MKKREQLLPRILKIVPEVKEGLTRSVLITFVYEAIKLIPVILIKLLIDSVVELSSTLSLIIWIVIGMLGVYLFSNIFEPCTRGILSVEPGSIWKMFTG